MPGFQDQTYVEAVDRLVSLYEEPFGGKKRGRFRISMKLLRSLCGHRRVWPEQMEAIGRALYERGYLLVDMETYCVVVSQQTFISYRRVNEAGLASVLGMSALDATEFASDNDNQGKQ